MKRFLLFVVLMCCVAGSVVAQTVGALPNPIATLQSGQYYLILAKHAGVTDSTGNYLCTEGENIKWDVNKKSSDYPMLSTIPANELNHLFYVTKEGSMTNGYKLVIRPYKTEHTWNAPQWYNYLVSNAKVGDKEDSLSVDILNINGDDALDAVTSTKLYFPFANVGSLDINVYATCSSNGGLTYRASSAVTNNATSFEFYRVYNVPEEDNVISLTYQYTLEGASTTILGESRYVKLNKEKTGGTIFKPVYTYQANYPSIETELLPGFVTASVPSGKVTADNNGDTIRIACRANLPFEVSAENDTTWYYLQANDADAKMLSGSVRRPSAWTVSQTMSERAAGEAAASFNDVEKDLWCVFGNPFDGFEFYNRYAAAHLVKPALIINTRPSLHTGSVLGTGYEKIAVVDKGAANGGFAIRWTQGNDGYFKEDAGGNYVLNYTSDAKDDAATFRLTDPVFEKKLTEKGGNTYNTHASVFDFELADSESDAKIYTAKVGTPVNGVAELELTEVTAVPAYAGVLLMGTTGTSIKLRAISGTTAFSANDLVGNVADITAGDDVLVLGWNLNDEVGFRHSAKGSLSANHAYLPAYLLTEKGVSALSFNGVTENVTGIDAVMQTADKMQQSPIYDVTGRKVEQTIKGHLYIRNGKKFIAE